MKKRSYHIVFVCVVLGVGATVMWWARSESARSARAPVVEAPGSAKIDLDGTRLIADSAKTRAMLLLRQQKPKEALRYLRKAAELNPQDAMVQEYIREVEHLLATKPTTN
jgi:tetratricopeptide (TPR) repeat protein